MAESRNDIAAQFREEIIQNTVIPCENIRLSDEPCGIFDSKVGGLPYLPQGAKPPVDPKGKKLYLLAQINCEDLSELSDFPHKGMLQFFISDDDLYGCTFTIPSPQEDWKVIYYPEIDRTVAPSAIAAIYADQQKAEFSPVDHECKMNFSLSQEGLTTGDYRYEQMFLKRWNETFPEDAAEDFFDIETDLYDAIFDESHEITKLCSKVDGYPYFTQFDPRSEESSRYDTLLFQLDTDMRKGIGVMWGDAGVGNFFINREALKRLDFSDVLYNWDCG